MIKDAAYVHQHRGTAGAVRRSLGAVNLPTTVVEWWQDSPQAAPYTFRIEVHSSQGVSDALYHQIRQLTDRAKNLRSHLSKIDVLANIGMDGAFIFQVRRQHISMWIFLPGSLMAEYYSIITNRGKNWRRKRLPVVARLF